MPAESVSRETRWHRECFDLESCAYAARGAPTCECGPRTSPRFRGEAPCRLLVDPLVLPPRNPARGSVSRGTSPARRCACVDSADAGDFAAGAERGPGPRRSRPNKDGLNREAATGNSKRGRHRRFAQRCIRNVPRETSPARALRRTEQCAPRWSSQRPGSSVPAARAPDVDCGELWRTDGGRRWSGVAVGRRMAQDSAESRGFSTLDLRLRVSASCSERQQCFPQPCGQLWSDNAYEHPSRSVGADLVNGAGRARLGFLHTSHPEPVARAAMFHVKHRSGRHA